MYNQGLLRYITTYQEGGSAKKKQEGTFLGLTGKEWLNAGTSMIPIYGSAQDLKELYDNPSWSNAGFAGVSILSEFPLLKWLKPVAKGAKVATRTVGVASRLGNTATDATLGYTEERTRKKERENS